MRKPSNDDDEQAPVFCRTDEAVSVTDFLYYTNNHLKYITIVTLNT